MPEEIKETKEKETIVESNGSMTAGEQADMKAQLEEEKQAHTRFEEDIVSKDARITALEADVSARDAELATAKEATDKSAAVITELQEQSSAALKKYKEALIAGHPDIPEALISGDSFQTLFDSVEKGKTVVEAVSEKLKAAAANIAIPTGSPVRGEITLNGLSAREKIAAGIKPK